MNKGTRSLKDFSFVLLAGTAVFMLRVDSYIVNIALPTISREFHADTGVVSWVSLAYHMFLTGTLLIFGRICDRAGVKLTFSAGFAFFTMGSLACGLSPNIWCLLASRCLQGTGASMMYVGAFGLVSEYVPEKARGRAFGIITTLAGAGILAGAPLGGIITGYASWHWVFLVNVPVGAAAAAAAYCLIPGREESAGREHAGEFDLPGAALSMAAVLILLYALNQGDEKGWLSPVILAAFCLAVILLAAFILRERRAYDPLLDLSVFSTPGTALMGLANLSGFLLLAGSNFIMPFFLEVMKGLSPQAAGSLFLIYSLVYLLVGPGAGRLSDRVNPALLCACGMIFASIACAVFVMLQGSFGLSPAVIYLILTGIAYGLFIAPNNNLFMGLAPQNREGITSATFSVIMNLSLVLGTIVFETVLTSSLPRAFLPQGKSLAEAGVPPLYLQAGFRNAFLVGAAVSAATAILYLIRYKRGAARE